MTGAENGQLCGGRPGQAPRSSTGYIACILILPDLLGGQGPQNEKYASHGIPPVTRDTAVTRLTH
jgi:hypothetical protein